MVDSAETRALTADAREILAALAELVRVYQFRDRNRICCHDVSVTQCYALQSIARGAARTQNELAEALWLDKSTASRVLDALERKGYVARRPHRHDRRALRLVLTAAGRRLLARIERDLLEEQKRLIVDVPRAVRRTTARLMVRLARNSAARIARTGRPSAAGRSEGCA
jgi:DNA-binding MarR family transcriptional regulator